MATIFVNRERQSLGQFSAQEISNGLASGQFLPTDLGWQEGMETWQPLSAFADLPPPGAAAAPRTVPPAPESPGADFEQPGLIRFDECLNKAWDCFKANWGMCVVTTLVFFVISAVVQFPMQFAEGVLRRFSGHGHADQVWLLVAGAGVFLFFYALATALSSILGGGFMYFFIETLRTKKANIDNLFAGFRRSAWLQLLFAMLVWLVAIFAIALVVVTPGIYLAATMKSSAPALVAAAVMAVPVIYLSVGIGFAFPLIIDKKLGFKAALLTSLKTVHRQWFRAFGLLVLVALVGAVGVLACCVGMLATLPIAYLIWAQGYRQLFGDGDLKPQD